MWRRTLVYLGLVEEPEEDELSREAQTEDIPVVAPEPARKRSGVRRDSGPASRREAAAGTRPDGANPSSGVRPLTRSDETQTHVRQLPGTTARVSTVRATTFDDAEQVGTRFRSGQPILVDVADVDSRTARRLLDFAGGVTFALRGRVIAAGARAFLLLPEGIEVPPEERRRLADAGYRLDPSTATRD